MASPNLGTAVLRTSLDRSGLTSGLNTAKSETNRAVGDMDKRMKALGGTMKTTGRNMSLFITAPIVGMGVAIGRTAANFESSMKRVQAITGVTGGEFERLEGLARELGETTQFSASEAADGMGFLAQAGFTTNEIMEALPGTLQLAAAGSLDLASAADLASNVLTGFGLNANEIGRVNDVLAKTASSANTNVSQLGEAMSFAAPVAAGFGVDIEQSSAAIGLLSDAGIQASRAGTGFSRILSILSTEADKLGVEVFDASGNMRPFADILEDIEDSGLTATEAMEIFGQRGGPAMQALLSQGSEALRELQGELQDAGGTAEEMAEKQMEGLNGALKELRSALEGLALSIADAGLLDMLTGLAQGATTLTRKFSDLPEPVKAAGLAIAGVAAAAGPMLYVFGSFVSIYPSVVTGITAIKTATVTFGNAAKVVFGPLGVLAAGVGIVTAIANKIQDATNRMNEFAAAGIQVQGLSDEAASIQEAIFALQDARREFVERQGLRAASGEITREEAAAAVERYDARIEALRDRFGEVVREAKGINTELENTPSDTDTNVNINVNTDGDIPTDGEEREITVRVTTSGMDGEAIAAAFNRQDRIAADPSLQARLRMNQGGSVPNDPTATAPDVAPVTRTDRTGVFTMLSRFGRGGFLNPEAAEAAGSFIGRTIDEELTQRRTGEELAEQFDRYSSGGGRRAPGSLSSPRDIEFPTAEELAQQNRERVATLNEMNLMFSRFGGGRGRAANRDASDAVEAQVFRNIDEINRAARAREELSGAFARFASSGGDGAGVFSPGQAQIGGRGLTQADRDFNDNLFAFRPRETSQEELDAVDAANEAREQQVAAAEQFRDTVINAGASFATDLASAIRTGDVGGAVEGLFSAGGSVLGSLAGPFAPLVQAGTSILGGLVGSLFGGNGGAEQRRQEEAQRMNRVPSVNINFTVEQTNNYRGGPSQPENEQAFRRQASTLFEELYRRHLGPELQAIKNHIGMPA